MQYIVRIDGYRPDIRRPVGWSRLFNRRGVLGCPLVV